jgi:hypothetical protein
MIQHARVRRVACPSDLLDRLRAQAANDPFGFTEARRADESLDVLLKHAFTSAPAAEDKSHVWQKLARKMKGPFGAPALEGPTQSSLEVELTVSGGWALPVPFTLAKHPISGNGPDLQGRAAFWGFLRCDCLGNPQPSSLLVLS